MHRKAFAADWGRSKDYLIRPALANQPILSPIYESPEPQRSQDSADRNRLSPLPDLIVERVRRYASYYEDESEEFYKHFEIRMIKLYRRLFLGEKFGGFDEIEITCGEQIPDYSDVGVRSSAQYINDDDEDGFERREDDDEAETLRLQDEQSDAVVPTSVSSFVASESFPSEEQLAETEGEKPDHSGSNKSSAHQSERTSSGTGKNLDESEGESSSMDLPETGETVITQAVIETRERDDAVSSLEEPELMRRQRSQSVNLSMPLPERFSKDKSPDLNTALATMEDINLSVLDSVAMDVESLVFQPLLCSSTPVSEKSPVLGKHKIASGKEDTHISAKRRRSENQHETEANKENLHANATCTETAENNSSMEAEANLPEVNHNTRNVEAQTSHFFDFVEVSDEGTQTEMPEMRDNYTQTNSYSFEFWRGLLGFNYYFFF